MEKPGFEKDQEGELVLESLGKPIKRYRLRNSAQKINTVSIREAGLPLAVEEFSEKVAGYPVVSLVNCFSEYDQCTLDPASHNIMAFHTPLEIMRITMVLTGYMNAMQAFERVMRRVLQHHILGGRCEPFIDDVAAKATSRSRYPYSNGKPKMSAVPGVLRYISESIHSLNELLADIGRAGGTISGFKSAFVRGIEDGRIRLQ